MIFATFNSSAICPKRSTLVKDTQVSYISRIFLAGLCPRRHGGVMEKTELVLRTIDDSQLRELILLSLAEQRRRARLAVVNSRSRSENAGISSVMLASLEIQK